MRLSWSGLGLGLGLRIGIGIGLRVRVRVRVRLAWFRSSSARFARASVAHFWTSNGYTREDNGYKGKDNHQTLATPSQKTMMRDKDTTGQS
jgi:hypothetical protein